MPAYFEDENEDEKDDDYNSSLEQIEKIENQDNDHVESIEAGNDLDARSTEAIQPVNSSEVSGRRKPIRRQGCDSGKITEIQNYYIA